MCFGTCVGITSFIHVSFHSSHGALNTEYFSIGNMLMLCSPRYERDHSQEMSCEAISQMLSIMLYNRRFFPYYCFNIIGGLDETGVYACV